MPAAGSGELLPGWRRVTERDGEGKRRLFYVDELDTRYSPAEYRALARLANPSVDSPVDALPSAPAVEPRPLESAKAAADPRATSEQISQSLVYVLLIVTGIIGFVVRDESLVLTEEEAAEMALPAGNILSGSTLNRRYGKYIRDSGDYAALAYSLTRYGLRVAEEIRTRSEQRNSIRVTVDRSEGNKYAGTPATQQTAPNPAGGAAPGDHARTAPGTPAGAYQATPLGGYSPIPRFGAGGAQNGAGGSYGVPAADAGEAQR